MRDHRSQFTQLMLRRFLEQAGEFARTVYMRMNTSGVVVDVEKIRASTDGFTVADQVAQMRSII